MCVYDKHVGLSARLSVVELINEDLEMVLHAYLLYLVLSLSLIHTRMCTHTRWIRTCGWSSKVLHTFDCSNEIDGILLRQNTPALFTLYSSALIREGINNVKRNISSALKKSHNALQRLGALRVKLINWKMIFYCCFVGNRQQGVVWFTAKDYVPNYYTV